MREISVKLSDVLWRFAPTEKVWAPGLPVRACGSFISQKEENKRLFYVVDNNLNIWLGTQGNDGIMLEFFDPTFAMDVIFNYNILAWAQISREFPLAVYAKIRKEHI
jgi:hypothetical protein